MATSAIGASSSRVNKQVTFVISDVFWTGRKGRRNRVIRLTGVRNGYDPKERWADVDASIARIIVAMNNAGLKTSYCCSGRKIDHENTHTGAYIKAESDFPISFVKALPEGVFLDGNDVIRFQDCGERRLARRWKEFFQVVKFWSEWRAIS